MQAGDYTVLAESYAKYRPDYSATVLDALIKYTGARHPGFVVADIGAGTGIWTKMLCGQGLDCIAVEPNRAMRREGIRHAAGTAVRWYTSSAEKTGRKNLSVNWVTMASSFHWVKVPAALKEFSRILKPRGFLTVLWNPRRIEGHPLHEKIERFIYKMIPRLRRVSSGSPKHAHDYGEILQSTGDFNDVIFFEARHQITMSKERYLGAWRSANDVQRQAGAKLFKKVLAEIAEIVAPLHEIIVAYQTRAWTARKRR